MCGLLKFKYVDVKIFLEILCKVRLVSCVFIVFKLLGVINVMVIKKVL